MERKVFQTTIDAPKEKVWDILWNDITYREWCGVFSEGSWADTDWKEGSKARFLSPEGSGMFSRIVANKPREFMGIEHLGLIEKGVEVTEDEKVGDWKGARENYSLSSTGEKTELTVEMDISDAYIDYFSETWPKALSKIKELSENGMV